MRLPRVDAGRCVASPAMPAPFSRLVLSGAAKPRSRRTSGHVVDFREDCYCKNIFSIIFFLFDTEATLRHSRSSF